MNANRVYRLERGGGNTDAKPRNFRARLTVDRILQRINLIA